MSIQVFKVDSRVLLALFSKSKLLRRFCLVTKLLTDEGTIVFNLCQRIVMATTIACNAAGVFSTYTLQHGGVFVHVVLSHTTTCV